MEQLHSMQTQLIERPLTDCGGRQWCVSFASRLGSTQYAISAEPLMKSMVWNANRPKADSSDRLAIAQQAPSPCARSGPSRNDLLGFSLVKGVWNPSLDFAITVRRYHHRTSSMSMGASTSDHPPQELAGQLAH